MSKHFRHDPFPGASAASAFVGFGRFGAFISHAPEDGSGGGGAPAEPETKDPVEPETKDPVTPPTNSGPSDADAKLIKDLGKAKDKLRQFEGVDVEEYKTLKAAAAAAVAAKTEQERKDAEARGEFDRVKASMVAQHDNEKKALQDQIDALTGEKSNLGRTIDELTIGSSFLNSKFVADDLVLPPGKARTLYGNHFVQEDGKIVAYDKPAGASERTKLVDAKGEVLSFDEALKRIVEADADKDRLLRTKAKDGAGSSTIPTRTTTAPVKDGLRGLARIQAGLATLDLKPTKKAIG